MHAVDKILAGNTKVDELETGEASNRDALAEGDVGRFDVSMDVASFVHVAQRAKHCAADARTHLGTQTRPRELGIRHVEVGF